MQIKVRKSMESKDFRSKLLRYAIQLTQDYDDAQDLLQQTLIRMWNKESLYCTDVSVLAWSKRMMYRIFLNNKAKQQKVVTVVDYIDYEERYYDYGTYDLDKVAQLIGELQGKTHEPIKLFLQGYQYYEIAEKLCVTVGTVKSNIHASREVLKMQIRELYCEKLPNT